MHLHVSHEAAFAQTLPTDGAHVAGPFVQPLVLFEGIIAQESLVALGADEFAAPLVGSLVLIIPRKADEALLTLNAAVRETVEPHVSGQLIRKLKNLLTLLAFGVFLCKVFVHWSRNQKPPVNPRQLSLFLSFPGFQGVLFGRVILFFFPLAGDFLLLSVFTFPKHICFYDSDRYVVCLLDVLLYSLTCAVCE